MKPLKLQVFRAKVLKKEILESEKKLFRKKVSSETRHTEANEMSKVKRTVEKCSLPSLVALAQGFDLRYTSVKTYSSTNTSTIVFSTKDKWSNNRQSWTVKNSLTN